MSIQNKALTVTFFWFSSKQRLKTTPTFALEKQTRLVRKQTRFILTLPVAGAVLAGCFVHDTCTCTTYMCTCIHRVYLITGLDYWTHRPRPFICYFYRSQTLQSDKRWACTCTYMYANKCGSLLLSGTRFKNRKTNSILWISTLS